MRAERIAIFDFGGMSHARVRYLRPTKDESMKIYHRVFGQQFESARNRREWFINDIAIYSD